MQHSIRKTMFAYRGRKRRGAVMIIVIALFAMCMAIFALWAKSAIVEKQRMTSREFRIQAGRLAEAGLARAIARRAADPQYDGETWSIAGAELGGRRRAEVRIRISGSESGPTPRVESVAEYPAGEARRARITKRRELLNTPARDQP